MSTRQIHAKKSSFGFKLWKGKEPTSDHYMEIIDEPVDIYDNGSLVCSYRFLPEAELFKLSNAVSAAKCKPSARTRGVKQVSAVFGALPRVPCREDYCRFSADTRAQPHVFKALSDVGLFLWKVYKTQFKEVADKFEIGVKEIDEAWRKTGTPFTTVNVNKNFAIGYHKDSANFKGVFSNVLISKKFTSGGLFVMPEYGIALSQSNGALVIVDGANVVHGVTGIVKHSPAAHRASVVFYTLNNLIHCFNQQDEIKRSKKVTTERARKRANKISPLTNEREEN